MKLCSPKLSPQGSGSCWVLQNIYMGGGVGFGWALMYWVPPKDKSLFLTGLLDLGPYAIA